MDCRDASSGSVLTRRKAVTTAGSLGLASALGHSGVRIGRAANEDDTPEMIGGVYAVEADADGSSDGSRVRLGTLGHHHEWIDAPAQSIAVEEPDGREHWRFASEESFRSIYSGPTVVDETVFFGSDAERIYAVDASTGEIEWTFETDAVNRSSPQVVDGTVFVGGNAAYALDADTGEQQWRFDPEQPSRQGVSTPVVADGTVFVGSAEGRRDDEGRVYAIDAAAGEEEWHADTDEPVAAAPTVVEDRVFVTGAALYALRADTGEQAWRFELEGTRPVVSSPTVVDGTVFVGSDDGTVTAVDAETGDEEWHFETGGSIQSSPTVAGGALFVGSYDDHIYALDAETGEKEWRFETEMAVNSSPTVVDGVLFIGNNYDQGGPEPEPEPEPESEPESEPEDQPGFGIISTLTALGGLGYLVKQRVANEKKRKQ